MAGIKSVPVQNSRRHGGLHRAYYHSPRPSCGGRYTEHDRQPLELRDFRRQAADKDKALDTALDGLSVRLDGLERTAQMLADEMNKSINEVEEAHGAVVGAEEALHNHRTMKEQYLSPGTQSVSSQHRRRSAASGPALPAAVIANRANDIANSTASAGMHARENEPDELAAFIAVKENDELDAFLATEFSEVRTDEALLASVTLKTMDENLRIVRNLNNVLTAAQTTGDSTAEALAAQNERLAKVRDKAVYMEGKVVESDKRWRRALSWCGFMSF